MKSMATGKTYALSWEDLVIMAVEAGVDGKTPAAHYFFVSETANIKCAECGVDRTPKPGGPIDTSGECFGPDGRKP